VKKELKPGRAFGYGRASTDEQEATLLGQEQSIRKAYESRFVEKGYGWGGMYLDRGVSGGTALASRPKGYEMLLELKPGDLVIILKIDRAWRNANDCLNTLEVWKHKGVRLCMLDHEIDTGTPAGQLMVGVLAIFAQFERGMVSERMQAHWALRRSQGLPVGGRAPYGYKKVGPRGRMQLVRDGEVRLIGARIVEWAGAGWSFAQITKHLKENGVLHPLTARPFEEQIVVKWYHKERALRLAEEQATKKVP
jgi:DNA invertase Pin-like site-specific DNA recombinase